MTRIPEPPTALMSDMETSPEVLDTGGDTWLAKTVAAVLRVERPWYVAVAVGIFLRLQRLGNAGEVVAQILAGNPPPCPQREWAANLSDEVVADLLGLASERAWGLCEELEFLTKSRGSLSRDVWEASATRLLVDRDDLESVLTLFAGRAVTWEGVDYSARVRVVLETVDHFGAEFVGKFPTWPGAESERLRRAGVWNPLGWWTKPAFPGEDSSTT